MHDAAGEAEPSVGAEQSGTMVEGMEGESWTLVGGHPESPLNVIAGVDHLNIHDTGMGGWVVMNGAFGVAEPLLFVGERSTWYGKMFAGRSREAVYDLLDTSSRPIVRMEKSFSMTSTSASVSMISQGHLPVGPVDTQANNHVNTHIGTITSEWDAVKRRLLLIDSTPNHAAGTIALESPSVLDDTFRIKLGDAVLGTVTRPRFVMLRTAAALFPTLSCLGINTNTVACACCQTRHGHCNDPAQSWRTGSLPRKPNANLGGLWDTHLVRSLLAIGTRAGDASQGFSYSLTSSSLTSCWVNSSKAPGQMNVFTKTVFTRESFQPT